MEQLQPPLALVQAAQAGDKQAFGQLAEYYQPVVRQLALRMVGDQETARELAQEAMLQAYLSLAQLADSHKFSNWLYGITLNVCRSHWRNRKTDFLSLEALAGGLHFDALPYTSSEPGPEEIAELRDLSARVLAAVEALSPKNRAATLLFYFEQLRIDEIAALLGISPAAVKGRLHKSRLQLAALLAPVYGPPDGPIATQERKRPMVKVTIADVVRDEENDNRIIVLLDEAGERLLPIWIGPFEADAIAFQLLNKSLPRPLTYEFIARLLAASGATLEEVRVETLQENTYYAVARLRSGDKVAEIDARPSDAIALALHTGTPIYVAGDVMAKAGIALPESWQKTPLGKGLAALGQQLEQRRQEIEQKLKTQREEAAKKEEGQRQEERQKLLTYLFGSAG